MASTDNAGAYVGHMDPPHGTSISTFLSRASRSNCRIPLDGDATHTHKARVVGNLMFTTNCVRPCRSFWCRARTAGDA